jgi:glycosyltransferase involved in cell wall biosynthesis
MQIGLEMLGAQTSGRHRGVGRYCRGLAGALAARAEREGHGVVLYAAENLPDAPPSARRLRPEPDLAAALNRVVLTNPDGLDALILVNPLELTPGFDPPARPASSTRRPALAAVVHDLIPWVFADDYLRRWPGRAFARRYFLGLERLRTYDLLLTNSEATRADVIRLLNVPAERVVAVGTAADGDDFAFGPTPEGPDAPDPSDLARVRGLGIDGPFLFAAAGPDPRKNLRGLVESFARLPETVRDGYRLAASVGASDLDGEVAAAARRADDLGVLDRIHLLTRRVDDPTLRALYRLCAAFVFPSRYEGFGLPLLEALACGAAAVAGDNSAQPEVAGDAALLVDTDDPGALAAAVARVLTDPALARSLRARGPARAAQFSWDAVAGRVLEALRGTSLPPRDPRPVGSAVRTIPRAGLGRETVRTANPTRGGTRSTRPPRVALFSPLPPSRSGVADYVATLLDPLADRLCLDLFHDADAFPHARFSARRIGCFDHRLFERIDRARPYDAVIYQMGNSPSHIFLYDQMMRRPGVVVLHDLALGSFHYERVQRRGLGLAGFRRTLEASHADRAAEFDDRLANWSDAPEATILGLTAAGFDMNGEIVARARAIVVHSRGALERLGPAAAGKAVAMPLGAEPRDDEALARDRASARARLGLTEGTLVLGAFGLVHPSKLNAESVEAFAAVASAVPGSVLMFVGEEVDGGLTRRRAEALGLSDRVRFRGRVDDDEFLALAAAVDLGLALRRPPTHGETSAALLHLLRCGVPTVVTDAGSFAEYPEGVVRKIAWAAADDPGNVTRLRQALLGLALDPDARAALGRAGREHVRAHHGWARVAGRYAEIVAGVSASPVYRGPHRAAGVRTGLSRGDR